MNHHCNYSWLVPRPFFTALRLLSKPQEAKALKVCLSFCGMLPVPIIAFESLWPPGLTPPWIIHLHSPFKIVYWLVLAELMIPMYYLRCVSGCRWHSGLLIQYMWHKSSVQVSFGWSANSLYHCWTVPVGDWGHMKVSRHAEFRVLCCSLTPRDDMNEWSRLICWPSLAEHVLRHTLLGISLERFAHTPRGRRLNKTVGPTKQLNVCSSCTAVFFFYSIFNRARLLHWSP